MPTETASARSCRETYESIAWAEESPLSMTVETRMGVLRTRHGRFVGGLADQIEVIEVDTGKVRAVILPTRGMSIWQLTAGTISYRWDSPVSGPVHPSSVPIYDPSGIGWLEGFDEFVVRCGLESNGAPEHDSNGNLIHPLHGRIGNLPASSLSIDFDVASGRLDVIGEVLESRLFVKRLRLKSRIRFNAGSPDVELLDDVTNDLSTPTTIQLLYHINVGSPVLGDGATIDAPIESLAPKDSLSASEIGQWNQFEAPQTGYAERVYFATLQANENHLTTVMLKSADESTGLAVTFNTQNLSRFVLWKNTAAESDGYVTGLEPATNFPNVRSYEQSQGRVLAIEPDQTHSFRVKLHPLVDAESVRTMATKIDALRMQELPEIHNQPRPGWSPGA